MASLAIGTTFLLSPISSILVDKFGIRKTAFTGGFIATLGMFLSSFAVERVSLIICWYYLFNVAGMSYEKLFDKISKLEIPKYYVIFVYFQAAVSALLAVLVLYVEKNQNKIFPDF